MAHQVQKSRKICGTCAYWGGLVRELNNTYVSVETGFMKDALVYQRLVPKRILQMIFNLLAAVGKQNTDSAP